ncbi:MAG: nadB, partial [Bacteroidetes bacterium]|nr:nadB [Bacteroidota bacterium]
MDHQYDFLVIGSGLAGLTYALKVSEYGSVAIITKSGISDTNTSYAQGGIAAVASNVDNFDKHIQDTLVAGDGLCNRKVVEMVVREGPAQIQQLLQWGTDFDRATSGNFDLAREGGHSENRIFHHKDNTGSEIQKVMCSVVKNHPRIDVFENFFAIDIITQHHLGKLVKRYHPDIECYGAYVLDLKTGIVHKFLSKITMMATGGTGNVYHTTTNPLIATGDGIA